MVISFYRPVAKLAYIGPWMEDICLRKTHSCSIHHSSHRWNCASGRIVQSRWWKCRKLVQQILIYVLFWPGARRSITAMNGLPASPVPGLPLAPPWKWTWTQSGKGERLSLFSAWVEAHFHGGARGSLGTGLTSRWYEFGSLHLCILDTVSVCRQLWQMAHAQN